MGRGLGFIPVSVEAEIGLCVPAGTSKPLVYFWLFFSSFFTFLPESFWRMDVIVSPLCPIMFHDRYFLLDKWWNSWHGIPGLQPSGLSLLFLPIPHYWVLTGPALSFLLCVFSLAASSDRTYYPHPYSLYKSNPKPPRLQSLPRPSPSGMNLCFPHTPFLLITISTAVWSALCTCAQVCPSPGMSVSWRQELGLAHYPSPKKACHYCCLRLTS